MSGATKLIVDEADPNMGELPTKTKMNLSNRYLLN
jgi:hypothetical protein